MVGWVAIEFEANKEDLQPGTLSKGAFRSDLQLDDWWIELDLQVGDKVECQIEIDDPVGLFGDWGFKAEEGLAWDEWVFNDIRPGGEVKRLGLD